MVAGGSWMAGPSPATTNFYRHFIYANAAEDN